MKSVVEYFQEMYGFNIQYTHLPCLQVGNQKKANYLPMEVTWLLVNILCSSGWVQLFTVFQVLACALILLNFQACKIVEGQRYTKRLSEKQITALLKFTCQRPRERENDILQVLHLITLLVPVSVWPSNLMVPEEISPLECLINPKHTHHLLNKKKKLPFECI